MNFPLRRAFVPFAILALLLIPIGCTQIDAPAQPAAPSQPAAPAQPESAATAPSQSVDSEEAINIEKINLNDMTREQLLDTIPQMGNRMLREFFEYQPYVSIQQFRREIGKYVDDVQVAFYADDVFVPVDVNQSDLETMEQVPGVADAVADTLMPARPFDSNAAFLEALAEHISAEQLEGAAYFLKE